MVDRIERNKDLVQELVESTATHVGAIATIITGAVADVAREVGDLFTDGFEMRDAARRARLDEQRHDIVLAEEVDLDGTDDDSAAEHAAGAPALSSGENPALTAGETTTATPVSDADQP